MELTPADQFAAAWCYQWLQAMAAYHEAHRLPRQADNRSRDLPQGHVVRRRPATGHERKAAEQHAEQVRLWGWK